MEFPELLCSPAALRPAVVRAISLLEPPQLALRGIAEPEEVALFEPVRELLRAALRAIDAGALDFAQVARAMSLDQELRGNGRLAAAYMGKTIDVLQMLKAGSPRGDIRRRLMVSLHRTGHELVLDLCPAAEVDRLCHEIVDASATCGLFEISLLVSGSTRNPLYQMRRSMGDRSPEEYFSEIHAGWLAEAAFVLLLNDRAIAAELTGTDAHRRVMLKRPDDMGAADLIVGPPESRFRVELQRCGKATRDRDSGWFKIDLKGHKVQRDDTLVVIWVGPGDNSISDSNSALRGRLLLLWARELRAGSERMRWIGASESSNADGVALINPAALDAVSLLSHGDIGELMNRAATLRR